MKFKINKGTETFNKLDVLYREGNKLIEEAKELVKELSGERYCSKQRVAWGGIEAIEFPNGKPEGWKMVGEKYQNLYYPKATNKDALKKIESLQTIPYESLNEVVGFDAPQTVCVHGGIHWISCVGLYFGTNFILMEISEGAKYEPINNDIVEILESEFTKLQTEIE